MPASGKLPYKRYWASTLASVLLLEQTAGVQERRPDERLHALVNNIALQ